MKNNRTKKQFEQSLFSLLQKKNYHDITVNEICALVNKTKMTFYRNYKDKDALLAEASINLVNKEYNEEYDEILAKETDVEEIEYQSLIITFDWVAKHYNQIQNLIYKGETFPLEIFKNALFDNYTRYLTEVIASTGYDIPSDYMSIFCFEGLYNICLYYAEKLNNNKNKKKTREDAKKACRLLAKAVMALIKVQ